MAKKTYIPEGYHNVTPSLSFKGTDEALIWYKNVFGAKEKTKIEGSDRKDNACGNDDWRFHVLPGRRKPKV